MDTRVLIFGDSITWGAADENGGWAERLKSYVDKKRISSGYASSVYVLGVSGDTSEDLVGRFEQEVKVRLRDETDIYVIFGIGVNDSQVVIDTKTNKVPFADFSANLQKLVDVARDYTKQIIFIGLAPINEELINPMPWNNSGGYLDSEVEKYNKELQKVANANGITFIDVFTEFKKVDYKKLLFDGLHPNTKGHEFIYNLVISYLLEKKII